MTNQAKPSYPPFAFKYAMVSQNVNLPDGTGYMRFNVRDERTGKFLIKGWTRDKLEAVELVEDRVWNGP
jgi:hypothetical protein